MSFSLDIVSSLDELELARLYGGGEWTCRAVLQMLPELEQHYILRLACCGPRSVDARARAGAERASAGPAPDRDASTAIDGVPLDVFGRWANRAASERHGEAVARLRRLRLVCDDGAALRLDAAFAANVRAALCSTSRAPWQLASALKADKRRPTVDQLDQWMVWRWNTVLLYIVGEELDEKSEPASQVVGFLRDAKLMAPTTDDGASVEITGKGLEFLLKGRPEQLWELVEQYVRSDSADRDELVAFILTLAYCAVGDDYAVEALSQAQRRAITVLGSLGMVYQRTLASARFYPTQLGVDVAFGLRDGAAPAAAGPTARRQDDLQIIVQTNFQVLAYTDATAATSKLVMAMLLLFCTLRVRLPNLVVGDITRSAIKQCISRGIRVPQICRFLESHAHPLTRGTAKALPENVVDQMTLWAGEENRVSFTAGVLVSMKTEAHFDAALQAAEGQCHWHDRAKRRLFVSEEAEPTLRRLLA